MTGMKDSLFCFIIVLITIGQVFPYCPTTPDPCLETTYSTLQSADDLTRSSSYFDINAAYFGDFALLERWYRATTGALSGDMPTEAPDYGHCQALYPVWFNETFPTLAEGPVQRKACIKTFNGNCSEQLDICIKKCNLYNQIYNVYWLSRPSNANARYCFDYSPTTTVAPQQATTTSKTYGQCHSTTDPCTSHAAISSADRNVAYSDINAQNLQDASIIERWYRAVEPAGVDMPTSAPGLFACQALSPVWLNETMPSVSDGIVDRKACVVEILENCSYNLDICIKNCGNYNVYFLSRPSNTYARYCFESSMGGETSPTTTSTPPTTEKTTTTPTTTMSSTTVKRNTDPVVSDKTTEITPGDSDDQTLIIAVSVVAALVFIALVVLAIIGYCIWKAGKLNEKQKLKYVTGDSGVSVGNGKHVDKKVKPVSNVYTHDNNLYGQNGAPPNYSQYYDPKRASAGQLAAKSEDNYQHLSRQKAHDAEAQYQTLEDGSRSTKSIYVSQYEEIPADKSPNTYYNSGQSNGNI